MNISTNFEHFKNSSCRGNKMLFKIILTILLQLHMVFAVMNVNLTLIRSNDDTLKGNGLWLFCVADQNLRDVDWFKDNVRLDTPSIGQSNSNFLCPDDMDTVDEICEIPYINGHQLYVPDKDLGYTESWKCLAEPIEGYPVESESKLYKANVCPSSVLDVVMILDESGSVGYENYQRLLQFTKNVLHHTAVDSGQWRVGMIEYSSTPQILFYLNSYTTLNDILTQMNTVIYYAGSTNTADALLTMHTDLFNNSNGDRPNVPNIAVLFTDGLSNTNWERTIPEATNAKNKGISIYTVCINLSDESEVKQIASDPYSTYGYVITSFEDIEKYSTKLFESIFFEHLCPPSIPTLFGQLQTPNVTATVISTRTSTNTSTSTTLTATMTCECVNETIVTKEELTKRIEDRRKRLIYNKDSTPLGKRKYTSASDDRYLATVIGYISIALLSFVFLIVLTIDCIDICRNRRKAVERFK